MKILKYFQFILIPVPDRTGNFIISCSLLSEFGRKLSSDVDVSSGAVELNVDATTAADQVNDFLDVADQRPLGSAGPEPVALCDRPTFNRCRTNP